MINVFIDTSIFVAEGYVKEKSIATLFDAAQEEKISQLVEQKTQLSMMIGISITPGIITSCMASV